MIIIKKTTNASYFESLIDYIIHYFPQFTRNDFSITTSKNKKYFYLRASYEISINPQIKQIVKELTYYEFQPFY